MKKTLKLTFILAALLFAGAILSPSRQVSAHSEDESTGQPVKQAASDVIEFETPKGGSLSLLVRRALQIIDSEDDSLALNEAQIIYAETNIVNQLGPRLLEIGEHVKLEKKLLKEFAAKSQKLSKVKIAAWQKYASRANFKLAGVVEPIGAQKPGDSASETNEQTPNAKQEGLQQGTAKKPGSSTKTSNDDIGRAWLIGISILVITYYLTSNLFDRSKSAAAKTSAPRTRKSPGKRR